MCPDKKLVVQSSRRKQENTQGEYSEEIYCFVIRIWNVWLISRMYFSAQKASNSTNRG